MLPSCLAWAGSRALADRIKGAIYRDMPGLGHFPMSENPELFLEYTRPVLDEIADCAGGEERPRQ